MPIESPKGAPPEKRAKIMVVDDDPDLRHALSIRLRANQFDIVKVCDGYSAIALAQKERPNLIILDLGLPAGDGFVVLKNLQKSSPCRHPRHCSNRTRSPHFQEKNTRIRCGRLFSEAGRK
jgi:CheY-like chemotaxis protein